MHRALLRRRERQGQGSKLRTSYFSVPGIPVALSELQIEKAQDLANKLSDESIGFARLVECRKEGESESVIFDLDIEVPQEPVHSINAIERISARFYKHDDFAPDVNALRKDFPIVPHLNLHLQEYPRNLCIYDDLYDNLKLRWSSQRFVQDIRNWLALTAKGELHQDDQPLEPILVDYDGHIVLPNGFSNDPSEYVSLSIAPRINGGRLFFLADDGRLNGQFITTVASIHRCHPQTHGVLHRKPVSLSDLCTMTEQAGLDLLGELRSRLKSWLTNDNSILDRQLIVVVEFPKQRMDGSTIEAIDRWAFLLRNGVEPDDFEFIRIREFGIRIGIWEIQDQQPGLIIPPDTSKLGERVGVTVLNVIRDIDQSMATLLNGEVHQESTQLVAVGLGALGSQVVMNAARSGFGTWTLIDHDYLMPHNLVRHSLNRMFVGYNKAVAVAFEANSILHGTSLFSAISSDVLRPGRKASKVLKALKNAHVILDMSASESVARALARDVNGNARRISLFLTPTGKDLVMLAEDKDRKLKLDALEMQYYRAVLNDSKLKDHLDTSEDRYRYAQSCRDVTARLPQYLVSLHASIGTRALRTVVRETSANVAIWQAKEDGTVKRVDVKPAEVVCFVKDGWEIITDKALLENLYMLRKDKLPNETGGVLLGTYDLERKIIYIVDALPSPPDSEEWPTLYIRGCEGLCEMVTNLSKKVHGMIAYIGEWHTHPDGAGASPSNDDLKVVKWLDGIMGSAGLPAVMMIVEQPGRVSYCVAKT